jgi:4-amino-4-deoxychorismate lyase
VVDRHPQELIAHLDRLAHSARLCDLPVPHREQWAQAIAVAAGHCAERGESVIKLILSRGVEHGPTPTAWVTAADAPDNAAVRERGIRVVTLDRGYGIDTPARAPWLLLGAKTLSYAVNMAAIREAKRRGADDAIFVSSDGFVLEAPTASLVLRVGERFVTPAPNGGILHGTTQLSLFEHLGALGHETAYETIPVSALKSADAAWLLSSVRLAAPITAIDESVLTVDRELTASFNEYLLSPRA